MQKNVYSVYRLSPPSIGFAKLAPEYENRGQWPASLDNFTQTQTQTRLSTVLDTFPTYAPTSSEYYMYSRSVEDSVILN